MKGGGHATNPTFSSTKGVQIALSRFNETKVNPSCTGGTVEIGAGLTWDQVYVAPEPAGVNVVVGRVAGVGETKVHPSCGTVEVGAGLTWGQVYVALEPAGVNLVGGRVPSVGVAGLTLGGGECLQSSESWISGALRLFIQDESVWTER